MKKIITILSVLLAIIGLYFTFLSSTVKPLATMHLHSPTLGSIEKEENFPSKNGIIPVTAIEMPKNSIAKLNIGDTVSLPYMGTGQFDAKITTKTTHKNGSITVTGNLVDSDSQYSVVLTEGNNMSFGTVTTPHGSYEIEVKNGQGYVYSTDSIDNEWVDDSKKDTLIPMDTHVHQ